MYLFNVFVVINYFVVLFIFMLLQTFSITNVFSLNLLNALEEWVSEDSDKYLGTKKLVLSWEDVADVVGVKNPKGILKLNYLHL